METLIDALAVALLGAIIVFLVLTLVILLIKVLVIVLRYVEKTENKKEDIIEVKNDLLATNVANIATAMESSSKPLDGTEDQDKHIIVIAAAITAYLGSGIRIRSIRQIKEVQGSQSWQLISRTEQNHV